MLLHTDLFVNSMERALSFYVDGLGFEIVDDFEVCGDLVNFVSKGRHNRYRVVLLQIRFGSAMLELIEYLDDYISCQHEMMQGSSTIAIFVPSLEREIGQLKERKIYPSSEIFFVQTKRFGDSRIIFYHDPDGNMIEFLEKIHDC